MIYPLITSTDI